MSLRVMRRVTALVCCLGSESVDLPIVGAALRGSPSVTNNNDSTKGVATEGPPLHMRRWKCHLNVCVTYGFPALILRQRRTEFRTPGKPNMPLKFALSLVLLLTFISCSKLDTATSGKPRSTPVQVGETAPDFTLEDQNGKKVTLSAVRVNAPTVLAFYRGNW
ncbi:MAG: hypothetical protein C5B55_12760 [Blastocatellia bacterium]|nr:MAG: hypothetical protein C5B55_12760 [Blastocatellia bacterium]